MSHVNTTPHYGLPIYGENDIINPLTDFNDANSAIDTALYDIADAQGSEAGAISDINTFLGDKELETVAQNVTDAVNEVNTAVGNADTAIGNVAGDVVTLQNAVGNASTGLIHDVGELQTTVGSQGNSISAIQIDVGNLQGSMVSAKADISDIKSALQNLDGEDVAYDGTVSGLSATNVQSAIDELANHNPEQNFGTSVNISSYNSYSNLFTIPADGYLQCTAGSEGATSIVLYGNNTTQASDPHLAHGNNAYGTSTLVFVKKGFKVYNIVPTQGGVNFIPLV